MGITSVELYIEHNIVVNMLEAHMAARYAHTLSKDKVHACVCVLRVTRE